MRKEVQEFIDFKKELTGKSIFLSIDSCIGYVARRVKTLDAFTDWYFNNKLEQFEIAEEEYDILRELIKERWKANALAKSLSQPVIKKSAIFKEPELDIKCKTKDERDFLLAQQEIYRKFK